MMKRTIISLMLLVAFTSAFAEPEILIAEGEAAYAEADYTQALVLFDSANVELTSAALLYNIGNCHFKLRHIPQAVLYYERAARLSPSDEDIKTNLTMARQMIVDRVKETPRH